MSVATKLAEERRRRHSASVGSRYGNGRSAGHDVCCAGEGDCACDRSNSEQGRGAERWARWTATRAGGLGRAVGGGDGGGGVGAVGDTPGPRRLQGRRCRKKAVSGRRARRAFEDEASPATRY